MEAVQTNVFGTLNLVRLAVRYKAERFCFSFHPTKR